ncbi:MAG: type IV pilus biogenesis/stability protein PilW [Gammaproteobacteria bacterium]|nr:type IV pilus biogenesis/stability protein PilW [Gammaproteobacteria bacterium]
MVLVNTLRAAGMVAALLALAGCVSSSSRPAAPASKEEAAQYNMQLGVSYLRQGELKTAQAKLEKAIADDPSLVEAHTALGLVLERLGDLAGAEKSYRRAVSLDSASPDALNALGAFLCMQRQEPVEALRLFDKALAVPLSKADANRAMINANAGTCARRVDMARAEAYLRAALAVDPNYRAALLQLADVTFTRGNALQSRAFLERYLAAAPATPDALWLGVRVEQALGETGAAERYATRLRRDFPTAEQTRLLLERERNGG